MTEDLTDVAVLLPAFNCQDDLTRTLASIREFATVRVLVVDDGSQPPMQAAGRDGLAVDLMRLPVNGGIEAALAAGVETLLQQGVRYIARIDAGDEALPGRLTAQHSYLEAHPRVGVLGTSVALVRPDGRPIGTLRPPVTPAAVRRQRFARTCLVHPAVMLRAEAVREAGNYRARYRAAEDLDLFLRIMERYEGANLPEVGLRYELNEGGISATRRRRQVVSTLRLQLRYFNWANPFDWLGLLKNLLHLVTPYRLLRRVKSVLHHA